MRTPEPTWYGAACSNTAMSRKRFEEAAHVVEIDHMHFHRFSSTPLENNVIIAQWDPKDERHLLLVQQFLSLIRDPVPVAAPGHPH